MILPIAALILTGCLGGSGGSSNDAMTGQLTLIGIEGLRYETASQSGTTNSDGEFRYYEGETISFWLGGLQIATDVPAKPFLTPIDFSGTNRSLLQSATTDQFGLSTHTLIEERLARHDSHTVNITRLLLILDEDKLTRVGDGEDPANNIRFTERVLKQFNAALARTEATIDFNADIESFAAQTPASPINAVIDQICFFPEDDRRCDAPVDQNEIDQLEAEIAEIDAREEAGEDIDEANREALADRLLELRELNRDILDARRAVGDRNLTTVETFLTQQTREFNSIATREYYITPFEFNIPASDTGIKTITIRSHQDEPGLTGLDAISTNTNALMVPRWSAQMREVDFYVTGEPGAEGEVRMSFRPAGDYRWFQFQVRPLIN